MHISKIPFDKINALSYKDVTYQMETEKLLPFINQFPTIDGIEKAMEQRKKYPVNRQLLVETLQRNYANKATVVQIENIAALNDEKTFTIVTAHQPSFLGGPAYYIYKICSVINLCRDMNTRYANNRFVPCFITGSEDHDFDEVKSLQIFGKSINWETNQTGSVGRFNMDNFGDALGEFIQLTGLSTQAQKISNIFTKALQEAESYNDFVFNWLNQIFGDNGLLVINMDDAVLKSNFIPIIKKEIFDRPSESLVKSTQDSLLTSLNFKPQAFVRAINFFYLTEGKRERIVFEADLYKVQNTTLQFTEEQLNQEIDNNSVAFSPNVVTRPLYEEYTLPNLAYIGGGGEIAYWIERKSQFEHFGVFFPVLIRRNSVMILPKNVQKNIEKLGLSESDILMEEVDLVRQYVSDQAGSDANFENDYLDIKKIFHNIAQKAKSIDPTLEQTALAEMSKSIKSVEAIEAKLHKAVRQKEETNLQQIKNIKSKLFPNGGLQERSESFWTFYVNENEDFLEQIIQICQPLEREFLFVYL
jgi:bacillithiol synthase